MNVYVFFLLQNISPIYHCNKYDVYIIFCFIHAYYNIAAISVSTYLFLHNIFIFKCSNHNVFDWNFSFDFTVLKCIRVSSVSTYTNVDG
jgi:hypothetical protein